MATRKCIKCEEEKALGEFKDTVRHKVNICRECISRQQREYNALSRRTKRTRTDFLEKEVLALRKEVRLIQEKLNS